MANTDSSKAGVNANDRAGNGASRRIGDNPVAALGAGFAVGALVGALLPSSRREREALQPIGAKIGDAARGAVDSGREKFGRLSDEVVTQVKSSVDQVVAKAKEETGA
mgnify:CR=1 FL=1